MTSVKTVQHTTRTLIVWGCTSGAGKSWLATALCRVAARRGLRVAPFKAQNMSNNARVVALQGGGYGEIGSAQYLQALAARVQPSVHMNPVLLKPESDTASQVVLCGVAQPALKAVPWRERSALLAQAAQASFEALAQQHGLIIAEGAGSPAEINLAAHDYVNLGTARWAKACGPTQALLVANIDQGGAFAHLYGTSRLLPDDLRPLLAGHVLNMFRGDAALLAPGPAQLQALTGVPVLAVVPRVFDHGLPEEDGWFGPVAVSPAAQVAPPAGCAVVAIVAYPRISNLDEFAPLAQVPGLQVRWARTAAQLQGADVVILPGSKQVSGDLQWLRAQGLHTALAGHVQAGGRVLGICGGLQMLGQLLLDPAGFDGVAGGQPGLGLLPVQTQYQAHKQVRPGRFAFGAVQGAWAALQGIQFEGYEIHHGDVAASVSASADAGAVLTNAEGRALGWQQGPVLGVLAHGLLECTPVLQRLFGVVVPDLEATFERLADLAEAHFLPGSLDRLLGVGQA